MRAIRATHQEDVYIIFRCPGCNENHQIVVGPWTWNGDLDLPTFSPSLLLQGTQWPKNEYPVFYKSEHASVESGGETRCHSFVVNGRIQFLSDCTHSLVGQTVDLPEWKP